MEGLLRHLRRTTASQRVGARARGAKRSFYPETTLTGEDDLIVFPSNEQLCLRARPEIG